MTRKEITSHNFASQNDIKFLLYVKNYTTNVSSLELLNFKGTSRQEIVKRFSTK